MSGATMTLEASTTSHSADSNGIETKSGDSTRSLVGMARTVTGPAWVDSSAQRFVRSWFNDAGFNQASSLGSDTTHALNSWAELSSSLRLEFLTWSNEAVSFNINGFNYAAATEGKSYGTTVGIDGVATLLDGWCVAASFLPSSGVNYTPISFGAPQALSEGYHYGTVAVRSFDAATVTWKGAGSGSARLAFYSNCGSRSASSTAGGSVGTNVVACILRNTGSGWFILDDADHTPIGVTSVSESSTAITLTYDFTASQVRTFIVAPDETFAVTNQYLVGASVGLSTAVIQVSVAGTPGVVDPTTIVSSGGNFWVYGLFD
jgi:hypothetical protein